MIQNFDHISDKRLIVGASGTGKSTLLLKQLKKQKARLKFIYDHQGEYAHKLGIPACYDPEGLCEKTAAGGYVIFDPLKMFSGKLPEGFCFFCDYVWAVCTELPGRKILCCDELQKVTDEKSLCEELQNILDSGRRFQIDCIFGSQAPNSLHNRVRGQITEVYTFNHWEDNALIYLKANGFDSEQVRNLPIHKYFYKNLRTGQSNFTHAKTEPERKTDSPTAEQGTETRSSSEPA